MSEFPVDRTAIVTGAVSSRGIGRATVDYLARSGWNIGVIDLDEAAVFDPKKAPGADLRGRGGQ